MPKKANKKATLRPLIYDLDYHIKESISFIRQHEPSEGYYLGFSGGKDSVVLHNLTEKAGVKFKAYYSATGLDPPELVKFIRRHYPNVIWKRPNWHGHKSFFGMLPEKGYPPNKFIRWCCYSLKKQSTLIKHVPLKHRLIGIRAEESIKRAKRPMVDRFGNQIIYKPIFHWLEGEIWEYIENQNLSYCKLYDEGFSRLGCVICPFICSKDRKQIDMHRARYPKYFVAFEKAMKKLWDDPSRKDSGFHKCNDSFEEFLDRWYRSAPMKKFDKKKGLNL